MSAAPNPRGGAAPAGGGLRPACSAFVAANAGSGKTHVLAQRVIRLMLDGGPAGSIRRASCASPSPRRPPPTWRRACSTGCAAGSRSTTPPSMRPWPRSGSRRRCAASGRARAPVRRGAGDAGRAQGADHPCLLHPAAPAVSVRGECRGALHACSTTAPRTRCSIAPRIGGPARGRRRTGERARPRAQARGHRPPADSTVRAVMQEAIGEREKLAHWLDAAGGLEQAIAQLSARARRRSPTTISPRSRGDRRRAASCRPRNGPPSPRVFAEGIQQTTETRRVRSLDSARGIDPLRADEYLSVFFTEKSEPRKSLVTKSLAKSYPDLARPARRRAGPPDRAGGAPQRGRLPRPHRGALTHRARGDRALRRREGPPRPARLRRPHRQGRRDARARSIRAGCITSSISASTTC